MVGRSESCVCRHIFTLIDGAVRRIHVFKITIQVGKQSSVINELLHLCALSSYTMRVLFRNNCVVF